MTSSPMNFVPVGKLTAVAVAPLEKQINAEKSEHGNETDKKLSVEY